MRNSKEIATSIVNGTDKMAKQELEKIFGKNFEEMTVKERQIGVCVLSAFDGKW